jgi:hypothetical protein
MRKILIIPFLMERFNKIIFAHSIISYSPSLREGVGDGLSFLTLI